MIKAIIRFMFKSNTMLLCYRKICRFLTAYMQVIFNYPAVFYVLDQNSSRVLAYKALLYTAQPSNVLSLTVGATVVVVSTCIHIFQPLNFIL